MARSSLHDPIEKFRFTVTVIAIDLSVSAALSTLGSIVPAGGQNPFTVIAHAGFQEITLPKATVSELMYRENTDGQRFSKGPGLVKFEPVVLRRGVTRRNIVLNINGLFGNTTPDMDLYHWYKQVNDDTLLLATARELSSKDQNNSSPQDVNFRKEVIIKALDREGNEVKQWILFNAFPITYKGGNDFNAQSDEKLIEELTLSYEFFVETEGGVAGLAKELASNLLSGGITSLFNPPF